MDTKGEYGDYIRIAEPIFYLFAAVGAVGGGPLVPSLHQPS